MKKKNNLPISNVSKTFVIMAPQIHLTKHTNITSQVCEGGGLTPWQQYANQSANS